MGTACLPVGRRAILCSLFTLVSHSSHSSPKVVASPQTQAFESGVVFPKTCIQFSSVAQSCPTLCDPMSCSTPGLRVHHQLPEITQTCVHRVSDAIQPSHPLSPPSSPAPNPSQHQSLFQRVNSSHEVAKYWSFSFSIVPSKEIPGLISFRMDWLDLLAVQGTLKSLLQYHSSKALILSHSAFFTVQLSHPYMTTGKTIALTMWYYNIYCRCFWGKKNPHTNGLLQFKLMLFKGQLYFKKHL